MVFKGTLLHEAIPDDLNASGAFVLPTLNEGCCKAIVEAMSCGRPIIFSDLPFNWAMLDERNSTMLAPNDVGAIAKTIERLQDNPKVRLMMGEASLGKAKVLIID